MQRPIFFVCSNRLLIGTSATTIGSGQCPPMAPLFAQFQHAPINLTFFFTSCTHPGVYSDDSAHSYSNVIQ